MLETRLWMSTFTVPARVDLTTYLVQEGTGEHLRRAREVYLFTQWA